MRFPDYKTLTHRVKHKIFNLYVERLAKTPEGKVLQAAGLYRCILLYAATIQLEISPFVQLHKNLVGTVRLFSEYKSFGDNLFGSDRAMLKSNPVFRHLLTEGNRPTSMKYKVTIGKRTTARLNYTARGGSNWVTEAQTGIEGDIQKIIVTELESWAQQV